MSETSIRIDKWLWTVRLTKTRALATEAVRGGRVLVNGQAAKPARDVAPGDQVEITTGPVRRVVVVRGIVPRRVGADIAAGLYEETDASRAERERVAEARRLAQPIREPEGARPTKRERRRYEKTRGRGSL